MSNASGGFGQEGQAEKKQEIGRRDCRDAGDRITEEAKDGLLNDDDEVNLQKLQTSLRRQSLSNIYDEITIMQQMNHAQHNTTMGPQYPDKDMVQLNAQAEPQDQQLQQHFQRQQMTSPPTVKPKPEQAEEEIELLSLSKENIDSFQKSMDLSVKSQQEIEVWDKKMGLKRSHSVTMTRTTRSRKNLRRLLEKHMPLDELGYTWGKFKSFEERIEELKAFKEKHGHVRVTVKHDKSLVLFCTNMRGARRGTKTGMVITEDRIKALDELGFAWEDKLKSFKEHIEELQAFNAINNAWWREM